MTSGDLIEELVMSNRVICSDLEGREILGEALKLKANADGVVKKKIREYVLLTFAEH